MKQNEIDRINLNEAMQRFFAGGGEVTVVPIGVSGQEVKPLKRTKKQIIEDIKKQDADRAKAQGRAMA